MYAKDLRERVVAAYDRGGVTEADVARLFQIGEATVRRWRRRVRETGSVAPAPHGGGTERRVGPEHEELVRALVAEQPDRIVLEVAALFVERAGRDCSRSSMSRALARMDLTRKKSPSSTASVIVRPSWPDAPNSRRRRKPTNPVA